MWCHILVPSGRAVFGQHRLSAPGISRRSRFLLLTKRSQVSGDEKWHGATQTAAVYLVCMLKECPNAQGKSFRFMLVGKCMWGIFLFFSIDQNKSRWTRGYILVCKVTLHVVCVWKIFSKQKLWQGELLFFIFIDNTKSHLQIKVFYKKEKCTTASHSYLCSFYNILNNYPAKSRGISSFFAISLFHLSYLILSRKYLCSTSWTNSFKEMDFSFSLFQYK